ncbi:MAG TPA: hypothetical protein VIJ00_14890, partial [Nakamurella sp.]
VPGGCAAAVPGAAVRPRQLHRGVAVAWLARGSPESPAAARSAVAEVEAFCADTGYPQTRFEPGTVAAAELLRRVGSWRHR